MNYKLSDFYTLTDIDGAKLSVDLSAYSVFVWNDYAGKNAIWNNDRYVSCWIVFRNLNKEDFIKFLNGKITLFELFSEHKLEYGYLKTDFDTLVVDETFRFEITLPDEDSALAGEAGRLVPQNECSFGNMNHLYIDAVSFGNIHANLQVTIEGERVENLSSLTNEDEWASFLRELGQHYQRLLHDQTSILSYSCEKWLANPSPVASCTVSDSFFEWMNREKFKFYQRKKNNNVFFIYKEGNTFRLFNGKEYISIRYEAMVDILCKTGDKLYSILRNTKYKDDIEQWIEKSNSMGDEKIIEVETGLDNDFPMSISYIKNNSPRGCAVDCMDPQLKAAARFSHAHLDDDEMLAVLEMVNEEKGKIQNGGADAGKNFLHAVIAAVPASVFSNEWKFFEQGYILAEYVRNALDLKDKFVDVRAIFNKFAIAVNERAFNKKIYALSLWSNDTIFILLNTLRNNSMRITLAHELAHVLVDRDGALPVAEVLLADLESDPIERRARAFAAEFLLPRNLARKYMDMHDEPNLAALSSQYGVSEIVAAQQIDNASKKDGYVNPAWKKAVSDCIRYNKNSLWVR